MIYDLFIASKHAEFIIIPCILWMYYRHLKLSYERKNPAGPEALGRAFAVLLIGSIAHLYPAAFLSFYIAKFVGDGFTIYPYVAISFLLLNSVYSGITLANATDEYQPFSAFLLILFSYPILFLITSLAFSDYSWRFDISALFLLGPVLFISAHIRRKYRNRVA